jgi:hypothetical protein
MLLALIRALVRVALSLNFLPENLASIRTGSHDSHALASAASKSITTSMTSRLSAKMST